MLVDNLALALAVTKGRATSMHLNFTCRKLAAISFASGSRFVTRWIPSEVNPADEPSRVFVKSNHHATQRQAPPAPPGLIAENHVLLCETEEKGWSEESCLDEETYHEPARVA